MCYGRCDTFPLVNGLDAALQGDQKAIFFWANVKDFVKSRNESLLSKKVFMVFMAMCSLFFFINSMIKFPHLKELSSKIFTWLPSLICFLGVVYFYHLFQKNKIDYGQDYRKKLEELPRYPIYNQKNFAKIEVENVLRDLPAAPVA